MTFSAWLSAGLVALAGTGALAASSRHTVAEQDCLWDLSKHYYQDPYRWRSIAGANPQVRDPNRIYPGQVLEIPDAGAAAQPSVELEASAPVEAGAAVEASAPIPAELPRAAPLPEAESVPEAAVSGPAEEMPPAEEPARPAESGIIEDSLSTEFPEAQAGQYPSFTRLQAPKGWKEDGRVTEFDGQEIITGPGDLAEAALAKNIPARVGDRLYILRHESPSELDEDQNARYLQRVGTVQVESILPKGRVRLRVLKAGGAVEAGDLLSRQPL
jgi:LysM repeat protein